MAECTSNEHRPTSGYQEDFVVEVEEEFQCPICSLPLKKPVQTSCGHRYCRECLDDHIRSLRSQEKPLTCPMEGQNLDPDRDIYSDNAIERKILSLVVRCPNKGCGWTGELRNKEVHLGSCHFQLVACTNNNCHERVQRKHLKQHEKNECPWRILQCIHCSEPHPECKMQDHIKQCKNFPLACPNSCGRLIPREKVLTHTKDECPQTIISCPYALVGCETKVERKEIESHVGSATKVHLDFVRVKLNNTEDELKETKDQLKEVSAKLVKTETLLKETRADLEKVKKQQRFPKTNLFQWRIESFSEMLRKAKNGVENSIESEPFYTRTETGGYGYKLKIDFCPNGYSPSSDSHVSVFIIVMKGDYDAILPWPFNKKVKLTLIDQQENSDQRENKTSEFVGKDNSSFARPIKDENSGWGFSKFLSHEKLNSRRFIVDDTLFLQVEISSPSHHVNSTPPPQK